jgi:mRNA interferase MazF
VHRGELYRVFRGSKTDPRKSRVFAIVSRQALVDSKFSTVICAPVYSRYDGLSTQLPVGADEGLKNASSIFCDGLVSIDKSRLTHFIGSLSHSKLAELEKCLRIALAVE